MDSIRWPIPGAPHAHWHARAFGQVLGDLDLDLTDALPPMATTGVLAACLSADGVAPAEAELWDWTINRRLQGLIAVTIATRGVAWTSILRCQACSAPMDLPLQLDAFRRDEDPLSVACALEDEMQDIAVPTGADQRTWLRAGADGPVAMLAHLLPQGAATSPERLAAVEAALAAADPLTVLTIGTQCPECGADNSMELDLEATCLALLAAEQPRLMDDIHALALAYHWTEAEVVAVPPRRRRQYLDRVERGQS
jgi:hypothetical protein